MIATRAPDALDVILPAALGAGRPRRDARGRCGRRREHDHPGGTSSPAPIDRPPLGRVRAGDRAPRRRRACRPGLPRPARDLGRHRRRRRRGHPAPPGRLPRRAVRPEPLRPGQPALVERAVPGPRGGTRARRRADAGRGGGHPPGSPRHDGGAPPIARGRGDPRARCPAAGGRALRGRASRGGRLRPLPRVRRIPRIRSAPLAGRRPTPGRRRRRSARALPPLRAVPPRRAAPWPEHRDRAPVARRCTSTCRSGPIRPGSTCSAIPRPSPAASPPAPRRTGSSPPVRTGGSARRTRSAPVRTATATCGQRWPATSRWPTCCAWIT